jgi:hypothetical protein
VVGSGMFAELAKPQSELMSSVARVAGLLNGGMFADLAKAHAGLVSPAVPSLGLAGPVGASGVLSGLVKPQSELMSSVARVAGLLNGGMFADLAKAHAGLMHSILPIAGMPSLACSEILRDTAMQKYLEAIAQLAQFDSLSRSNSRDLAIRNRERLLFANFIYCVVLSLVLLAYLKITEEGEVDSEILSFFIFVFGVGGHQIARKARKIALHAFDTWYPQGS